MLALTGTYYKGQLQLEKEIDADRPVKVIVTFLEENEEDAAEKEHSQAKEEAPEPYLTLLAFSPIDNQERIKAI
jgi:hypothetical protein